jgi:uncharacterized membrane protein
MLRKLAAVPLLAFIVLIEPLQSIAQQAAPQPPQDYYGPHMMWNYGHGFGWHFWWMFPMMTLFLLFFCGIIFLFATRFCGHGRRQWEPSSHTNPPWNDPTYSALQILNERLARGEIQKDEYTDKRTAIQSGGRA